jgi:hypothetical protein
MLRFHPCPKEITQLWSNFKIDVNSSVTDNFIKENRFSSLLPSPHFSYKVCWLYCVFSQMRIFIVNEGESGDANVLFYCMGHNLLMFYGYQLDIPFKSTVGSKQ